MAIENRDLPAGTRLVATYRRQAYACTVEQGEDGKKAYVLEDGRRFKSPSAAGSAVMGGVACNGWRLWSIEGTEPPKAEPAAQPAANGRRKAKGGRLIDRVANQQGVPDGEVRHWCNGCMKSFTAPVGEAPTVCPEGHDANDPQFAGEAE